jgi:hypothetical protein
MISLQILTIPKTPVSVRPALKAMVEHFAMSRLSWTGLR